MIAGMTTQAGEETGADMTTKDNGSRDPVFPHILNKRRNVRTLKDLICSIQTKEANKAVEIAQEGINEDDKSSSSGSDSDPSADELDVSLPCPYYFIERTNYPTSWKYTACSQ